MRSAKTLMVLLPIALSACTTELTSTTAGNWKVGSDPAFGYYLPRETYQITVTYQLLSCPDYTNNVPLVIQQSGATVTPTDVADSNEHYYITYRSMDNVWKNTTFQANVYPNQTLKSFGALIASQVSQSVANLMSAGENAAKMASTPFSAAGGPATCLPQISSTLAATKSANTFLQAYPPSTLSPGTNRSDYQSVLTVQPSLTLQVTALWDPSDIASGPFDFTPNNSQLSKWFQGDVQQMSVAFPGQLSTRVVLGPKPYAPATTKPASNPISGIVYREPLPTYLKICQGSTCAMQSPGSVPDPTETVLLTLPVSLPQAGPYVVVPLKNEWFDNNNLAITFGTNGVPCAIAYGTQSQVYQVSQMLNTASSTGFSGYSPSSNSTSSNNSGGGGGGNNNNSSSGNSGGGKGQGNSSQGGNSSGNTPSTGSSLVVPTCQ